MVLFRTSILLSCAAGLITPAFSKPIEKRLNTGPFRLPVYPTLGTTCNFAIVAKTGVATIAHSQINGNVAIAPAAMTYLTGFSFDTAGPGPSKSSQISGNFLAHAPESSTGGSPSGSPKAALDMLTAYTTGSQTASSDAGLSAYSSLPNYPSSYTNPFGGIIPPNTRFPRGVYNFGSTMVIPVSASIYIEGSASDIVIFVTTGAISTGAGSQIVLVGGITAASVFWVSTSVVTTGVSSSFSGIIMSYVNVVIGTSATLNGIVLTQTELAVDIATITPPLFGPGCTAPSTVPTIPVEPITPAPPIACTPVTISVPALPCDSSKCPVVTPKANDCSICPLAPGITTPANCNTCPPTIVPSGPCAPTACEPATCLPTLSVPCTAVDCKPVTCDASSCPVKPPTIVQVPTGPCDASSCPVKPPTIVQVPTGPCDASSCPISVPTIIQVPSGPCTPSKTSICPTCPKTPTCNVAPAPVIGKIPYSAPVCNNYIITINIATTCFNTFQAHLNAYTNSITVAATAATAYTLAVKQGLSFAICSAKKNFQDSTAANVIVQHASFMTASVTFSGPTCQGGFVGASLS